jgi:hypothetical protein
MEVPAMRKVSLLLAALVLLGSALVAGVSASPVSAHPDAVVQTPAPGATGALSATGQSDICPLCIIGYHCCAVGQGFRCFPESKPCP